MHIRLPLFFGNDKSLPQLVHVTMNKMQKSIHGVKYISKDVHKLVALLHRMFISW
jgi:hypothetical protein